MIIGVSSLIETNTYKALEVAISNHFEALEIICEWPYAWIDRFFRNQIYAVRSLSMNNNVSLLLHAPFLNVCVGSLNPGIRRESLRQIKKTLTLASRLEARIVTVHLDTELSLNEISRKTAVKDLKSCCKVANDVGVFVAVENTYESMPDQMLDLLKDVRSENLRITFDTGHFNLASESKSHSGFLEPLRDYLINVHIHDNNGYNDDHLPVGEGNISFPSLVRVLKNIGYDGYYIMEQDHAKKAMLSKARLVRMFENTNMDKTSTSNQKRGILVGRDIHDTLG